MIGSRLSLVMDSMIDAIMTMLSNDPSWLWAARACEGMAPNNLGRD